MASTMLLLALVLVISTLESDVTKRNEVQAETTQDKEVIHTDFLRVDTPTVNMGSLVNVCKDARDQRIAFRKELMKAQKMCLRGLIVVQHKGKFSNFFMQWASALGVAKRLNMVLPENEKHVVAIPYHEWELLIHAFDGVKQETISEVMERRTVHMHVGEKTCLEIVPDPESIIENVTENWELAYYHPTLLFGNKSLVMRTEEGFEPAVASVAKELRANLTFKEHYRDQAQDMLRLISDKVRLLTPNDTDSEIIHVGMHVHHANKYDFLRKLRKEPADQKYYVNALHWMVWTLRTKNQALRSFRTKGIGIASRTLHTKLDSFLPVEVTRPPLQEFAATPLIAVTIVSDDLPWVKKSLVPALRRYIRDNEISGLHIFVAESAGLRKPMVELAMLAQCNHSIISHGSYGVMGALFSGGRTVVRNMPHPDNFATNLAKFFPYWVLMK